MKNTISDIIFKEIIGLDGNIGLITLNRQESLNALNHKMFIALDEQLAAWEINDGIKAVVIQASEGRAFCAGGDIRYAYERKLAKDPTLATFFRDEYAMNKRIYHFPKPYIALLDGITMGGGAGISMHGSHRVATERFSFAMPETAIGFYPDVGATYVLSHLPHKFGYYLGLTGERISYADCFELGIANSVISRDDLPDILTTLINASIPNKQTVTAILNNVTIPALSSNLLLHQDEIEACFSHATVEEILNALEILPSVWCQQTAKILKKRSPTSLKVTLEALKKAEKLDFDACMQMEYELTCHFIKGHDFFEGIRAAIIDKDQTPVWNPERITDVKAYDVEKYFVSPEIIK